MRSHLSQSRFKKLCVCILVTSLAFFHTTYVVADESELPSWSEIEKAKTDIREKQKQIHAINLALNRLSQRLNEASDRVLKLSADYTVGENNLEIIDNSLSNLNLQRRNAQKSIVESSKQINRVITGMFQGSLIAFDLDAFKVPDGLLYGLTVMNRYTGNLSNFRNKMFASYNSFSYIQRQIEETRLLQKKLIVSVDAKRAEAVKSVEKLKLDMARKRDLSTRLLSMLASLKGTTLAKEKQLKQEEERAAIAKTEPARSTGINTKIIEIDSNTSKTGGRTRKNKNKKDDSNPLYLLAISGLPKREEAKRYAKKRVFDRGWNEKEWKCLEILWTRESTWRWNAYNLSSGAYGIPQALPGSKMANIADDWMTNQNTQIEWGLSYITSRYKTPCKAWEFWQKSNWY